MLNVKRFNAIPAVKILRVTLLPGIVRPGLCNYSPPDGRPAWTGGRVIPLAFSAPIDPKLDPPDGQQAELGSVLPQDGRRSELPFPKPERPPREFNAL